MKIKLINPNSADTRTSRAGQLAFPLTGPRKGRLAGRAFMARAAE
ncbi:hypothetical protein HNP73_004171 [Amaricoccus macauensis]|uniref:Uncharacterized protein n=1 Tax=Amaricoccus macauensis TaxID=57001 RepID=A0A840STX5_9RHOB|nr:hypothetical protein [Amaricoccus macauensis]MBB5224210.1 hypothetical protein [Amaricoccus macauensis]